jgi:hypothetical protein
VYVYARARAPRARPAGWLWPRCRRRCGIDCQPEVRAVVCGGVGCWQTPSTTIYRELLREGLCVPPHLGLTALGSSAVVSPFLACIGSTCLRHCGHGASTGGSHSRGDRRRGGGGAHQAQLHLLLRPTRPPALNMPACIDTASWCVTTLVVAASSGRFSNSTTPVRAGVLVPCQCGWEGTRVLGLPLAGWLALVLRCGSSSVALAWQVRELVARHDAAAGALARRREWRRRQVRQLRQTSATSRQTSVTSVEWRRRQARAHGHTTLGTERRGLWVVYAPPSDPVESAALRPERFLKVRASSLGAQQSRWAGA